MLLKKAHKISKFGIFIPQLRKELFTPTFRITVCMDLDKILFEFCNSNSEVLESASHKEE